MTVEYRIGDVFDRLAEIPAGSIDLLVTSPPFLALRSYLPADHPNKHLEIGSEPTPAEFLDTLLALTAEWGRVLAPHGSICVELGDTYSGSGGSGGDYLPGGIREGQQQFAGSAATMRESNAAHWRQKNQRKDAWPLAKSMCLIPHLYTASLAYGRNLLTGEPSPAGQWRIRNVICWARPNPPVGALGDKFRPATSYITVACKSSRRYFDLDAVRGGPEAVKDQRTRTTNGLKNREGDGAEVMTANYTERIPSHPGGAPPLDWHADDHPEDGDWLWKLPTRPYKGSHYATFPETLPKRLIEAMCPLRVCTVCGKPSERIVEQTGEYAKHRAAARAVGDDSPELTLAAGLSRKTGRDKQEGPTRVNAEYATLGWSDCGHNAWRTGNVLDPFAGSGTTLAVALGVGRHAIGIDIDERNADLARDRVGMFLTIDHGRGAA